MSVPDYPIRLQPYFDVKLNDTFWKPKVATNAAVTIRKIHQVDPHTGAIIRTIESNRFVTGVTGSTESSGTAPGKVTRAM